ncbi:MAG TPA: hypothetical protein VGF31_06810 [Myxococcaceae bacterium]
MPSPLPCAGIGTEASRLGHPISPPPGSGLRSLDALAASDGRPAQVVWSSELPGKTVDWALLTGARTGHALWALRRVEGGWCVLGSFVSSEPVETPMTMPDHVLASPTTAVALLHFESLPDDRTGITSRYVALASDGDGLWFALEGKGGRHLIAREAKLRKQGSKLFLDVPMPSKATAVLEFDGSRFVQLN